MQLFEIKKAYIFITKWKISSVENSLSVESIKKCLSIDSLSIKSIKKCLSIDSLSIKSIKKCLSIDSLSVLWT